MKEKIPDIEFMPPPDPLKVYRFSDMPRYKLDPEGKQKVNVEKLADEIIRLARQGVAFSMIAGRLGFLPDELRKVMQNNPDLQRAMLFGAAIGVDEVSHKNYEKAVQDGEMAAITLYLKARGDFEAKKPPPQGNVAVKSGDTTVMIDMDSLRAMTHEQSDLRITGPETSNIIPK
ncbi:MAG: hypothetical protein KGI54_17365 [Pseudomonadota bacterium]|nr:hypothetical protein [Pseudomonadota bacterium]